MVSTLRELYPFVRERHEIFQDIMDTPELKQTFLSWSRDNQEHFLDFCSGTKGVKMLYDGYCYPIRRWKSGKCRMSKDWLSVYGTARGNLKCIREI